MDFRGHPEAKVVLTKSDWISEWSEEGMEPSNEDGPSREGGAVRGAGYGGWGPGYFTIGFGTYSRRPTFAQDR